MGWFDGKAPAFSNLFRFLLSCLVSLRVPSVGDSSFFISRLDEVSFLNFIPFDGFGENALPSFFFFIDLFCDCCCSIPLSITMNLQTVFFKSEKIKNESSLIRNSEKAKRLPFAKNVLCMQLQILHQVFV
jgi:hypothetical protein